MKRDMDYVRQVLMELEEGKTIYDPRPPELGFKDVEEFQSVNDLWKLKEHLRLMMDGGLVYIELVVGARAKACLTWQGYDYLDAVRDPEIWKRTKDGAIAAGGFTFALLKEIAVGFLKKKVGNATGIDF